MICLQFLFVLQYKKYMIAENELDGHRSMIYAKNQMMILDYFCYCQFFSGPSA